MSETDSRTELQERLDQLATRLMVDGADAGIAAQMAQLSELARGHGCSELARIAADLGAGAQGVPESEDKWRTGIARLQEALDREAGVPGKAAESGVPPPASLAQDPELVRDFVVEAREHLGSIEAKMLVLEQNPQDMEAIHSVFRGFHTIKGLAGFLEFAVIQEVAHEVETLLDRARNGIMTIARRW
jgi:two-component system chemotaxis sensor kinase CheA